MNIWTQLLSLNGYPLDGELGSSAPPASARNAQSAPQRGHRDHERRDQETQAARGAIPLWRPAPWIAIR